MTSTTMADAGVCQPSASYPSTITHWTGVHATDLIEGREDEANKSTVHHLIVGLPQGNSISRQLIASEPIMSQRHRIDISRVTCVRTSTCDG